MFRAKAPKYIHKDKIRRINYLDQRVQSRPQSDYLDPPAKATSLPELCKFEGGVIDSHLPLPDTIIQRTTQTNRGYFRWLGG